MTRYQINIGDEFPVEPEHGGDGRRRFGRFRHPPHGGIGLLIRALFALSLAALVVTHPLHAAIGFGAILLFGRLRSIRAMRCGWSRGMHHGRRGDWNGGLDRGAFV